MSKISVLGLGALGARMAAHLIKAGHDVTVWNRTADATKPSPVKWGHSRLCAAKSAGFAVSTSHPYEAPLIRFSILAIEARIVSKAGGSAKIIAWVFS